MPAALHFAMIALLAAPEGGSSGALWLPTTGSAADRSIAELAAGRDGVLWAAGGGRVHRLEPGRPWRPVGRYAPEIEWDGGDRLFVRGPFPEAMLRDVVLDVRAAVEAAGGLDPFDGTIGGEPVEDFLEAFAAEAEASPESPFRVNAALGGERVVWLGTGAGLFRATGRGVQGPLPGVPAPVTALAHGPDGVYAGTPDGLYLFAATGVAHRVAPGDVRAVVGTGGPDPLVYVADGALWRWRPGGAPRSMAGPPGEPRRLAAHDGALWIATTTGVYRLADTESGGWSACAPVPEPPSALVADEGALAVVVEDALLVAADGCRRFDAHPVPWPGGMRMLDAARLRGTLFMSSTAGVFVLSPALSGARETLALAGFRRALAAMPTFDEVMRAAVAEHGLDRDALDIGGRAVLSRLLPHVELLVERDWWREELEPTLVPGGELEVEPPRWNYAVLARWDIPFDLLVPALDSMFDAGATRSEAGGLGDDDVAEALEEDPTALDDDAAELEPAELDDGEGVADVAAEVPLFDAEGEPLDARAGAVLSIAGERRLRGRERARLHRRLAKLYRQRQGALYRLWTATPDDVRQQALLLLELAELDAHLDACTGGEYGRLLRREPAGRSAGP